MTSAPSEKRSTPFPLSVPAFNMQTESQQSQCSLIFFYAFCLSLLKKGCVDLSLLTKEAQSSASSEVSLFCSPR